MQSLARVRGVCVFCPSQLVLLLLLLLLSVDLFTVLFSVLSVIVGLLKVSLPVSGRELYSMLSQRVGVGLARRTCLGRSLKEQSGPPGEC